MHAMHYCPNTHHSAGKFPVDLENALKANAFSKGNMDIHIDIQLVELNSKLR